MKKNQDEDGNGNQSQQQFAPDNNNSYGHQEIIYPALGLITRAQQKKEPQAGRPQSHLVVG